MEIVVKTGSVDRKFAEHYITQGLELIRDEFAKVAGRCAYEYFSALDADLSQDYQRVKLELDNWAKPSSEQSKILSLNCVHGTCRLVLLNHN